MDDENNVLDLDIKEKVSLQILTISNILVREVYGKR